MKNFLSLIICSFYFLSCSQIHFQDLSFEEEVALPSVVEKKEKPPELPYYEKKEDFILKGSQKPLVDILLLVDSSKSMYHHLDKLGKSLSHLLSVIQDYDWQIAFTSVDHGDHVSMESRLQQQWKDHLGSPFKFGALMPLDNGQKVLKEKILNKQTVNYENTFYHTLSHSPELNCERPPYCSGGLEQPLRSLKSALERQRLDNNSFFRPKADLVTLIITNDEERFEDSKRATKAQEVVDTFNDVFQGLKKKFINFSILVKDETCRIKEEERQRRNKTARLGKIIGELSTLTNGDNIDICSEDYGTQLEKISKHIKINLENSLVLDELPIVESVHVDFGQSQEIPWSIDGKKVIFKGKIKSNTSISIHYKIRK